MKSRVVIYHRGCVDGFASAWAAWKKFGDGDTDYIAALHGEPPPLEVIGRDVFIVDFSYPAHVIGQIVMKAKSVRVFDHHKSAEAEIGGLPFVVFDMNRSGAGITWDELNGYPRSWVIDYVEDRDLWRFNLALSKEANAWISCVPKNFDAWNRLEREGSLTAAERGTSVIACINQYVEDVSETVRWIDFEGHCVPIVNASFPMISELVGKLAESAPFAIGWHQGSSGEFRYSLRSRGVDSIDVSKIAVKYGGGGHPHSAGFTLDHIL